MVKARGAALLVTALVAGCSAHDTFSVGRPCSASEPCGPGAICDELRGVCVESGDGINTPPDAPPRFDVTLDGGPPLPDAPADAPGDSTRDSFIAPDGGCPASAPTQCGAVCVDITSDDQHCNGCNKACAANQRCNNSTCGCRPNYDDCDNNASNGCEAKLDSDQHCGACGNSCGNGASCSSGSCQCQSGRQNCDGTFSNGCECTTGCDGSNCKAVGCNPSTAGACGGSSSYCDNGTCRTCAAGFYNCDGTGGCECMRPCAGQSCGCDPNVSGWCGSSSKYCNTSTNVCTNCPSGTQNCNLLGNSCECSNGCSGTSCAPPPCSTTTAWSCGTSTLRYCSAGSCATCASGTRNCNGILTCECGPNTVCSGTSCACAAGRCNNNSSFLDGCEGTLGTNQHCSACGDACGAQCANGCRTLCSGTPKQCRCPQPPCPF